jgi:phage shock protein PspC (stress-responsive transcriptional regulator)
MNQTVTVNISGLVFYIEVGAYEQLNNYLETIKHYFRNEAGKDEIIADIETRIAELFKEELNEGKEVVTQAHVDKVIAIMGEPEAYIDEDADTEEPKQESKRKYSGKKLYRDEDDNVLGGVCSGIAHYFGVDRIWFRIAFLIAFFGYGTGLLLYLILWIIIPAAKTTAEKLEMKGEPINVDSIGNAIKSEFNSFKKKVNNKKVEGAGQRILQFFYQIADFLVKLITFLLRFIVKAIAVILMLASSLAVIALLFIFIGGSSNIRIHNTQLNESWLSSYADVIFSSPTFYVLGVIGIALVVLIPLVGIFYGSIKTLFNFSSNNKAIGLSAVSLWAIGVVLIFISGATTVSEFATKQSFAKTEPLTELTSDTLVLEEWRKSSGVLFDDNDFYVLNDSLYVNDLTVDVVSSKSDEIELYFNYSARGSSRKEATERAQNIQLKYKVEDNKLQIQEFISSALANKYRKQSLKLSIALPEGKSIYLDPSAEEIIYDIKNVSNTYDGKMLGHHWLMTSKGLKCIDCEWLENEKQEERTKETEDEKDSFEI